MEYREEKNIVKSVEGYVEDYRFIQNLTLKKRGFVKVNIQKQKNVSDHIYMK